MQTDDFADIRPYRDDEVAAVLSRMLDDDRLIKIIEQFKLPWLSERLPKSFQPLVAAFIRRHLYRHMGSITTVDEVQNVVRSFMDKTVKKTTSGFSYNGIDQLDPNKSYLFLSNHRDIAMDPALVSYALRLSEHDFIEIAIGDNLLTDPMVSDIMRLNRSFTVHRSVEGLKAKMKAFTRLSAYIHETLQSGRSIWLAQREGRAKDGLDKTDPAIIKMLYINGKKRGLSFGESIRSLNIVPVAISYEYDPCDLLKAKELNANVDTDYVKSEGEDIASIIRGISSPKGRVHIGFGTPLTQGFANADEVAAAVDQQVASQYKLFPSNIAAFEQLKQLSENFSTLQEESLHKLCDWANQAKSKWVSIDQAEFKKQTAEFSRRIAGYPEKLRQIVLEMYANPLINQHSELVK